MRTLTTILILFFSFHLWGQSTIPAWGQERINKLLDKYSLTDFLKPQYLEADFSGDNTVDLALLIERKTDKKKGLIILFKENHKYFIMGAGDKVKNGGDDFKWADSWEIFTNKQTYETTFKENGDIDGERNVKLDRPAIKIREQEGSGGLLYFDGEQFIWIHQGD